MFTLAAVRAAIEASPSLPHTIVLGAELYKEWTKSNYPELAHGATVSMDFHLDGFELRHNQ